MMTARRANGILAALADARIHARVIETRAMVRALAVALAFAANAMAQRIAGVAGQAGAHGPLFAGVIVAGNALRIRAAWIGSAQVLFGEWAAADERIAGLVARATADGRQAAQIAVGASAARSHAWILALAVDAGWPT